MIKVGSRDSRLAVVQAEEVMRRLGECELVTMKTTGDKILDRTLDKVGGKGLFVKELDRALAAGEVDLTVHSLKDVPMEQPDGLPLIAFPKRADARDALVLPEDGSWDREKPIGCSSARRRVQLSRLFPGIEVKPVRGNVQTRMRRLDSGEYGALVLAAAGLHRLGLENRIIYNLVDVVEGNCRMKQALIRDKRYPNLYLLPAAQTRDKSAVTPEQMIKLTDDLKDDFDYILLDCPAGIEQGFYNAIAGADRALVVTTPEVSAIRDADRIIGLLEHAQIGAIDLIVNRIRADMVRRGDMMSLTDVQDILAVNMIGAIPDDENIVVSTNQGEPLVGMGSAAGQAYLNVCRRLLGQNVPMESPGETAGILAKLSRILRRA